MDDACPWVETVGWTWEVTNQIAIRHGDFIKSLKIMPDTVEW